MNAQPRSSVSGWIVTILVLVILTGFSGLLGATAMQHLVTDLSASYSPVTARVIGEDTERVVEGNSRNRHWVEYRTVTVDYPTADGAQKAVLQQRGRYRWDVLRDLAAGGMGAHLRGVVVGYV